MFEGIELRGAKEVEVALRSHLGRLLPGEVPLHEAPALWDVFDAIERCASAAKLLLAERVEESRDWSKAGAHSAADHLARKAGNSVGLARCALETSKRLHHLAATEAALRRGELSSAQAQAIADAAAVNPTAEQPLLDVARSSTLTELREQANRAKAAGDPHPDATHHRIHRQRRLRRFTDAEGAWNLQARGTADAGAVLNAALDPIVDEIFRAARRDGSRLPRDAYAFDALLELSRRAGGAAPADLDPSSADTAKPGRRAVRSNPAFLALLRVDVESLIRGRVEGEELCEISGVGAIPAGRARELLGESVLKLVITRGVDVRSVTHLGRGPTAAQRVALLWASPRCTNLACSHSIGIQHDHRAPWADVRETSVANLDRLCPPCHARKTHEGWALVEGTGRRSLVPRGDPRHPAHRGRAP
jgi:hypothetical protein